MFWDSFGFRSPHSGIFRYAGTLSECLEARGVYPHFLVSWQNDSFSFSQERLSLSPMRQRVKSLWATWAYGELCQKYTAPFIFHGLSNLNLPLQKKSSRHIFFLTIHDGIPVVDPRGVSTSIALQSRLLFPRVVSLADRIICVSMWTKDWLERAYPKAVGKCVHIPNGFSSWKTPRIFSLPEAKLRILMVSRFEKYKQFDLVAKILQKRPDFFSVTVVSDDRGLGFLRERIGNAPKNVTFCSAVGDLQLQALYEAADVLLHTSRFEGFCLPAAEALSHGVPVVYMGGSGIDEVVGSSVGVGLTSNDTIETWIEALESWGKRRQTQLFQQTCSAYVKKQMQWSQAADLLLEEYRNFAFS